MWASHMSHEEEVIYVTIETGLWRQTQPESMGSSIQEIQ